MKMNSFRIICQALILILLGVVSGCAKQMVTAKDVDSVQASTSAVIKSIQIKDGGAQAEISTDRPLTYTSYKTNDPPRVFIDLAQTEPGNIKTLESDAGPIKSITVSRQDFGSGFLSRVEIALRSESEFTVKADPVDKGKLNILLPLSSAAKKPLEDGEQRDASKAGDTKEESATSSVEPPVVEPKTATIESNQDPAENNKSILIGKETSATPSTEEPTPAALKTLTGIDIQNDKIEIAVAGGPVTFTSFKLDKPERLVIDLFGTKNAMQTASVPVNRFGIAKARVGVSPGKVRIVFDSTNSRIYSHQLDKIAGGLKINFSEPAAGSAIQADAVTDTPKSAPDEGKVEGGTKGVVESIDFKIVSDSSRLEIRTSGACSPDKPKETAKGVLLNFKNCELPAKLQKPLDTKAFVSRVLNVTPYQVKIAGVNSTRVLVKLRDKAPYSDRKEGDKFILEIKNPTTAASVTGRSPKIEDEFLATQPKEADLVELPKTVVAKQLSKKIYTGRKVTLEFSDADIRKIFQLIAEVSNLNFLIADDVTGTISIKLVNVPWDQALDVILDTKGLGMVREGNIVQIKPKAKMQSLADEELAAKKARERGMELRTEIFDVNYAAVADIAQQFGSLKSDRGVISTDARTNRVIVKDISTAIEDMKFLLKSLDTPEKQVMIEARIVEASTSFVRDLGVQWGIHYVDGSASVAGISRLDTGFGGQVSAPPTSGTSGPGAAVGMSFGKLSSNIQLDMRLSAAVTANQIKIMSTPRVVTLNNKPAKISQGASIPYQTTSAEGTKTEFVEAALTLEVTPHITADGSIGMKIKASNNSPGTGSPPPINKKEATTELLVKNGETTVIGGIYVDSDTESDTGVPFLQDIPLLGWLFKSNTKNKSKNELLIFITPKIVS